MVEPVNIRPPVATCDVRVLPDLAMKKLLLRDTCLTEYDQETGKAVSIRLGGLEGVRVRGERLLLAAENWRREYRGDPERLETFYNAVIGLGKKGKVYDPEKVIFVSLETASHTELLEASIRLSRTLEARLAAAQSITEQTGALLRHYRKEAQMTFGKPLPELLHSPHGNAWASEKLAKLKDILIPPEYLDIIRNEVPHSESSEGVSRE